MFIRVQVFSPLDISPEKIHLNKFFHLITNRPRWAQINITLYQKWPISTHREILTWLLLVLKFRNKSNFSLIYLVSSIIYLMICFHFILDKWFDLKLR